MMEGMTITCLRCGTDFQTRADRPAKYCSFACRRNQVTRSCENCGAEFTRRASLIGRFCSKACGDAQSKGRPANPNNQYETTCPGCGRTFTVYRWREVTHCSKECWYAATHVAATCEGCGKEYDHIKAHIGRKFCSNRCKGLANVDNIAHFQASAYKTSCLECSATFTTTPKRSRGKFCSRVCFTAWMLVNAPKGEDATNWRGGYDDYYGPSWRPARRAARERDKVCQDCGRTREENGRELDVHHIVPRRAFTRDQHEEANDLANLVTLCPVCHITREWATNWR